MSGKDKQYNLIEANRIALEHDCITLQFTFVSFYECSRKLKGLTQSF